MTAIKSSKKWWLADSHISQLIHNPHWFKMTPPSWVCLTYIQQSGSACLRSLITVCAAWHWLNEKPIATPQWLAKQWRRNSIVAFTTRLPVCLQAYRREWASQTVHQHYTYQPCTSLSLSLRQGLLQGHGKFSSYTGSSDCLLWMRFPFETVFYNKILLLLLLLTLLLLFF